MTIGRRSFESQWARSTRSRCRNSGGPFSRLRSRQLRSGILSNLLRSLLKSAEVDHYCQPSDRNAAVAATKKTSEAASWGNVSLARYSEETGKNAQALAQLAQALRLNPENRETSGIATTQLSWYVPLIGSMRHDAVVISAQFSPDGQRVVTVGYNDARLWDAATGKAIGKPMKHEGTVNSAQFSPDGQRVVTTSWEKAEARLWDATSGKPIGQPMRHAYLLNSAQFSPDGQRVVTASADKTARLWDTISGKPIGEPMKHDSTVYSAQFSPDGQRVVTASDDKTARLWDAAIMTDKDTREDILVLAELAEATGGVTLETVGQAENFKIAGSRTDQSITGENRCETLWAAFENDSVTAIHEMERLGPHQPDDFSVFASHSPRMAGEQDQGGNSRRAAYCIASRSRKCPRNSTSWQTPCRYRAQARQ